MSSAPTEVQKTITIETNLEWPLPPNDSWTDPEYFIQPGPSSVSEEISTTSPAQSPPELIFTDPELDQEVWVLASSFDPRVNKSGKRAWEITMLLRIFKTTPTNRDG
jgi:hypothetical protein